MASKCFTKSLLSFYRFIRRRRRNPHAPSHVKLQKYPSHDSISCKILVFDVEGGLLRSSSLFPYFLLVALEGGGLLRGLLLLIVYPFLCCLNKEMALKAMVMVSFCGLRKDKFIVGKAVLPKFLLEDVGLEGFEVMRKGKRRVCVSRMPRVMVEWFLREYLAVEVVVGREMKAFSGFYTGFMEEERKELELEEVFGGREEVGEDVLGFGSYYSMSLKHYLFSLCKEIYLVSETEKRKWHILPRSTYPKPLVFHDGRIAFLPTPLLALAMFLYLPMGILISIIRVSAFILLPYNIAIPIGAFTGIMSRYSFRSQTAQAHILTHGPHRLYVCNHRTLLDPVYISATLNKLVTAVTYSLSPITELISPIPTVRLTRNKEEDRRIMEKFLNKGDLVVCPEGTTCREPYLLRFSPLFAELTDEIVPVALVTSVSMFYGTTASGFKWLDPFYFLMNPKPEYDIKFMDKIMTGSAGRSCSVEVANRVQKEIGRVLDFECTTLTRKDKYMMLAVNEGVVEKSKQYKQ